MNFLKLSKNIQEKSGVIAAKSFLQFNRELRQESSSSIMFLYTGSIGLPGVVREVADMNVINDLNTVRVPPLNETEAVDLLTKLLVQYKVKYKEEAVLELIQKIKWTSPFYVQLAAQYAIDHSLESESEMDQKMVDPIFDRMTDVDNVIYFESYRTRLRDAFSKKEHGFVVNVLGRVAEKGKISLKALKKRGEEFEVSDSIGTIMDKLEFDGYLVQETDKKSYVFISPILETWWGKYAY